MSAWHRLGRVFRLSNVGTLLFFLLNMALIQAVFFPSRTDAATVIPFVVGYIIVVLVSLSPVGEWILALFAGAREIRRKDIQIRLIPLLEIVFSQAKSRTPDMVSSIHLKIIDDTAPNAFAIGRKTICITSALLNLSDEEIMAVFAHEIGHIANKHSEIQLLIGGGNLFISFFLLIIKLMCWTITAIFGIAAVGTRKLDKGLLLVMIGSISSILIWLWTKFCMLFLMWSMRQNEYVADEYAFGLGYGNMLASVLDRHMCTSPENGFLKALFSTHPPTDNRIARLQELGATYSRY